MLPIDEKRICFELADAGIADFAELSIRTRMPTAFLRRTLDDLVHRGFVLRELHLYKLADGVREELMTS
jgi:DNA-binding IclR family transcriptional regulator